MSEPLDSFLPAFHKFFDFIGDDHTREGLKDTPARVLRSWRELFGGYNLNAEDVLKTTFSEYGGYDSIVLLKHIDFTSFCEHHLLPFSGVAHVGYLPQIGEGAKVVGLSKLARLVDMHAKRLQIQEKMTCDIANDLDRVLSPRGVGVIIEAHHSCMGCRGAKKQNARMVTSALHGLFKECASTRSEFFSLVKEA